MGTLIAGGVLALTCWLCGRFILRAARSWRATPLADRGSMFDASRRHNPGTDPWWSSGALWMTVWWLAVSSGAVAVALASAAPAWRGCWFIAYQGVCR